MLVAWVAVSGIARAGQASAPLRVSAAVRPSCVILAGGRDQVVDVRCSRQMITRTRAMLDGRPVAATSTAGAPGHRTFAWAEPVAAPSAPRVTAPTVVPGDRLLVLQF